MSKHAQHVVPAPNGGWSVKKGGTTRASKHFSTKEQAESYARKAGSVAGFTLIVHGRDGTVERNESLKQRSSSSKIPAKK